jgi:hypothetical protein
VLEASAVEVQTGAVDDIEQRVPKLTVTIYIL